MAFVIRRDAGLYGYERALGARASRLVAGADEAGRGACAGPLVGGVRDPAGPPDRGAERLQEADRRDARARLYDVITAKALAWAVVRIEPAECDALGMHVANLEALRRAVARLDRRPDFVLTDGFPVDGLWVPGLAMWKGDAVAACVARRPSSPR